MPRSPEKWIKKMEIIDSRFFRNNFQKNAFQQNYGGIVP